MPKSQVVREVPCSFLFPALILAAGLIGCSSQTSLQEEDQALDLLPGPLAEQSYERERFLPSICQHRFTNRLPKNVEVWSCDPNGLSFREDVSSSVHEGQMPSDQQRYIRYRVVPFGHYNATAREDIAATSRNHVDVAQHVRSAYRVPPASFYDIYGTMWAGGSVASFELVAKDQTHICEVGAPDAINTFGQCKLDYADKVISLQLPSQQIVRLQEHITTARKLAYIAERVK